MKTQLLQNNGNRFKRDTTLMNWLVVRDRGEQTRLEVNSVANNGTEVFGNVGDRNEVDADTQRIEENDAQTKQRREGMRKEANENQEQVEITRIELRKEDK